MRFWISGLALGLAMCASAPAFAAPSIVFVQTKGSDACDGTKRRAPSSSDPLHCAKKTIQAAVSAVAPGGTIRVAAGTYVENVIVDKPATIHGLASDRSAVIVRPKVSSPNPCANNSLCGGAASSVFLVRASDVTIRDLTVNGDNKAIKSGKVVGGQDIDARNGIIEDYLTGVYDRLNVRNVAVRNVFYRGIYAASGGDDFAFQDNLVDNVAGELSSVGIFAFGASGVMSGNTVTDTHDAISANHGRGIQIVGNDVRRVFSGVHLDNSEPGEPGLAGNLIASNHVENCSAGGFGAWVFVANSEVLVDANKVIGCTVGLAALGGKPGMDVTFLNNKLDGKGEEGSVGILVDTDTYGFGHFDVKASFVGNEVTSYWRGALVQQNEGKTAEAWFDFGVFEGGDTAIFNAGTTHVAHACLLDNEVGLLNVPTGVADIHTSQIVGNGAVGLESFDDGSVDATHNWWGATDGPAPSGSGDGVSGNVAFAPFLTTAPGPCGF